MPPKHGSSFKNALLVKYGLTITARDPKTSDIVSIKCKFCEFGKYANENKNERKRKSTERVKFYRKPWCKDNIEQHVREKHSKHYKQYINLKTFEDRIKYFDEVDDAKLLSSMLKSNVNHYHNI